MFSLGKEKKNYHNITFDCVRITLGSILVWNRTDRQSMTLEQGKFSFCK